MPRPKAAARPAETRSRRRRRSPVVVVVGAGLSGLTAAYRLRRLGVAAVVLEARHRVGGRAWRLPLGEEDAFDLGCEVLDEGHAATLALLDEVGVGWSVGAPWAEGIELPFADELHALAERIDPLHPEETDGAGMLDRQTLGAWLAERGAPPREAELAYAVASSTVPIARMSLLAYAAKLAAGAARHGLRVRVDGGPSALAERLADDVRLAARAVAIEQDAQGVTVRLETDEAVRAERAVVALPLTLQRELRFDPPLPEHRRLALERAQYGEVVKAGLLFEERFWDDGFCELSERGLVYEPAPGRPVLGVFAGAEAARLPVLEAVARAPRTHVVCDWTAERFSRGSYLIFGPGDLTEWGTRLAEKRGRIHFAGSETSELPSYVEGAIRAGERVAREVAAAAA